MKKILVFLIAHIYIITVFAQIPAGYYDGAAGLEGDALKTALFNIIKGHTELSYSDLWTVLKESDEDPNNSDNFILLYTGRSLSKSLAYPEWNREHVWAKSHGGFDTNPPAGTDAHHLRPTDVSVNSSRGNLDFDNGGAQHSEATECYYDSDSWEPRDAVKGDVARMMFYMATRYDGDSGDHGGLDLELLDYVGTSGSFFGKLSTLLEWNLADPVDDFERNKNEVVYSHQHNRNPFIDYPEWVECIWNNNCTGTVQNPEDLVATAFSQSQINLSWTQNSDNDNVVLAYNTTNTFGTLTGTYIAGQTILGGGNVIFVGDATSFSHIGLSTQTYYYKIWSKNTADEYSNGIETNAAPLLPEPANNVTDFIVSDETSNTISLTWTDATGGQLPEAYLVKASTAGINAPLDGTPEADAQFVKNINAGVETVIFSGLTPSTTYTFGIYPYTNLGAAIDYQTNSVVSVIGNTLVGSSDILNEDFTICPPSAWTIYSVSGSKDWTCDAGFIHVNAYGSNEICNDWLISPAINFDVYENEILNFNSYTQYTDGGITTPEVKLKYSLNYSGTGDPSSATWTEIAYSFPAEDSQTWTASGDVNLSLISGSSVYIAFVYTSSGTAGGTSTLWELDDVVLTGSFVLSGDSDSEVLAPITQIAGTSISSLEDTEGEAIEVFSFQIEDKGTSDGEITQVLNLRIYPAASNTADWSNHIQGVKLSNGSDLNISSLSITDTYINILTEPIDISDGTAQTFTLSLWLNTNNIEDASVLSFLIDADTHGFVASTSFSEFATVFNGSSDIISADFTVDVEATELLFKQQPTDTEINLNMNPNIIVNAVDENGNLDLDYAVAVNLSSDGTMTDEPISAMWNSGIAEFNNIVHTETGFDIELTAKSDLLAVNSNSFNIYCNPVDVSNLTTVCGYAYSEISWTNQDCFDKLILVVNNESIIGTPSGTYVANSTVYTDALNPDFPGGGKVVYSGTYSPQTITGLTNGTNYYFKIFVYSYGIWSNGVETNCMPISIENISDKFSLYPNPVKDILTIENIDLSETYTIALYDITGKLMLKITSDNEFKQIPLNSYAKGLYIIEISTKKNIYRDRIIIE